MSRRKLAPLRELTEHECTQLARISQAQNLPAVEVARAKALLAVAAGHNYQEAALLAGRRSGDAISHLVARFNRDGLDALAPRHGGSAPITYGPDARRRILDEVKREPTPEHDGTATWSLSILQRSLRSAPDGLPKVSRDTIHRVLRESGLTYQRTRTWCHTATAIRSRKSGPVTIFDPDGSAKKI